MLIINIFQRRNDVKRVFKAGPVAVTELTAVVNRWVAVKQVAAVREPI